MNPDVEQDVRAGYESVCAELNMDEQTVDNAWNSYEAINNDYVLEVSQHGETKEKQRGRKRLGSCPPGAFFFSLAKKKKVLM